MKRAFVASLAVLLLGTVSLVRASKEDDAKRYLQDLKTSKDVKVKIIAVTEIGNLGMIRKSYAKDAVPYLMEACKDKDAKLRAAAAEALGKVDPPEDANAAELLTELTKDDKDTDVRLAAMRGLAALGPKARTRIADASGDGKERGQEDQAVSRRHGSGAAPSAKSARNSMNRAAHAARLCERSKWVLRRITQNPVTLLAKPRCSSYRSSRRNHKRNGVALPTIGSPARNRPRSSARAPAVA